MRGLTAPHLQDAEAQAVGRLREGSLPIQGDPDQVVRKVGGQTKVSPAEALAKRGRRDRGRQEETRRAGEQGRGAGGRVS